MFVIDTNDNVSAHLGSLKSRGVVAVGRYYSSSAWKRITKQEAIAISKAGIKIFVVFENDGDPELTNGNGINHAQIAAKQARDIGQPEGSAIYFALEHLPGGYKKKHIDAIKEYIAGVKEGLAGRYKIGVYSDGVVCDALFTSGMCDYAWLSASLSFEGSKEFLASNRWSLAQDPHVDQDWDGLSIDVNQAKADFGQFAILDAVPLAMAEGRVSMTAASSGIGSSDDDPAFPAEGEISDTADLETARLLANLGGPGAVDAAPSAAPTFAASATLGLDIARAKTFLDACRTSKPRVTYGLGKKVPFLGAVPGRDFTQVDCSGFVREAIRLSTTPPAPFPDGSVVQHDWVRGHGFEKSAIADAKENDDAVRIAFLRPQDSPHGIGHVVLISGGMTLESHGGVGPDARAWTGLAWQAKAFVYVLARHAEAGLIHGAVAALESTQPGAATFTVHHGRRYRATIVLSGFEKFASNDLIASKLTQVGFVEVVVTGSGGTRQAEGIWNGADTVAQLDPHLTDVVELPDTGAAPSRSGAPVSVPSIVRSARGATGYVPANVFSTESLPVYHDELLIVNMRAGPAGAAPMAFTAMAAAPTTTGLSAISFYERAGMISRIVPLRRDYGRSASAPRLSAVAALTFSPEPAKEADTGAGINFIELHRGQNAQQLHNALATDPNVLSVSKVPARYLALPKPSGKSAEDAGIGIEATPPSVPILWNLEKIAWEEARGLRGFRDADDVRVAVLDTGVDDQHPILGVDGYHWEQPDLVKPVSNKDIIGHGTHVSGTITALIRDNSAVKGVCKCRLNVWKIFDDEPTYDQNSGAFVYYVNPIMYRRALAACVDNLDDKDSRVDVINLSIGGRGVPDVAEQSYFDQLIAGGVIICAAMGNDRQSGSPTSYPAAISGVIAVGATGLDDRVTIFSNSGNHIAIAAPGKAIWSTLPTYGGQTGFWADIAPDGQARQGKPMRREINYDAWDGTSMATPHVSGCAALLIAKAKDAGNKLTPDQVRHLLMTTADKVPGMNGADFSTDYGAGRINLLRLLQ